MLELLHDDAREVLCDEINAFEVGRSRDCRHVVRAASWLDRVERLVLDVHFDRVMRRAHA